MIQVYRLTVHASLMDSPPAHISPAGSRYKSTFVPKSDELLKEVLHWV